MATKFDLRSYMEKYEEEMWEAMYRQMIRASGVFGERISDAEVERRVADWKRLRAIGPLHHPDRADFLPPGRWGKGGVRITPYLRGSGNPAHEHERD